MLDLAAQSDDAEETIRHLAQPDLEAYASGRVESARLSYCQAHLDSCELCRDVVEDLRTYKNDLSAFPRPEPSRRRRGLTLPAAAAGAIVLVAAVTTVVWWKRENPPDTKPAVITAVAPSPAPPLAASASVQTRDTRGADEIAAVPGGGAKPGVPAPVQHGKVQPPAVASRSGEHAPTPGAGAGASQAIPGFALLGPLGEVSDTRPEFTWQPVAGAVHYSIAIVDARLHPVEHSQALHVTEWRPHRPLHHGRTYLWQVTATLPGNKKVVASTPGTLAVRNNRVRAQ